MTSDCYLYLLQKFNIVEKPIKQQELLHMNVICPSIPLSYSLLYLCLLSSSTIVLIDDFLNGHLINIFMNFTNTTICIRHFQKCKENSASWGRAFIGWANLNLDWMQYDHTCTKKFFIASYTVMQKTCFPGTFWYREKMKVNLC